MILHLSDVHLSQAKNTRVYGDYKSQLLPVGERLSHVGFLKSTLRAVGRMCRKTTASIDYIVVSGDITVAHEQDGFDELPLLLAELGDDVRPPPERIIVVPGNHDVKWMTACSSLDRYERFANGVRSLGYRTPYLDGVDDGSYDPLVFDAGRGLLFIPVNSSNYCGSIEPLRNLTQTEVDALDKPVQAELLEHRLHDVTRVSHEQLKRLVDCVEKWEDSQDEVTVENTVKIAVLHHHLLPVGQQEELKTFEYMTNVGMLLRFLSDHKVHLVLHGHKHDAQIRYERPSIEGGASDGWRFLVVAGNTLGGVKYAEDKVLKLLDVTRKFRAPVVRITDVPAFRPGAKRDSEKIWQSGHDYFLWDSSSSWEPGAAVPTVISGESCREVYCKVELAFDSAKRAQNVVCHVRRTGDALDVPPEFASRIGKSVAEASIWLEHRVGWWQATEVAVPLVSFNHGSRIRDWNGYDQLDGVVSILSRERESARAIVQLLYPNVDLRNADRGFPALTSVQFFFDTASTQARLCCVAYFRNQEMRLWWLVNVFELDFLLSEVQRRLAQSVANVCRGDITTVSAIATWSETNASVVVPLPDELYVLDRAQLWRLAFRLAFPSKLLSGVERQQTVDAWQQVLRSLQLPNRPDDSRPAIARIGLSYLIEEVKQLSTVGENPTICDRVADELKRVLQANERIEAAWDRSTDDRAKALKSEVPGITESVARVEQALKEVMKT